MTCRDDGQPVDKQVLESLCLIVRVGLLQMAVERFGKLFHVVGHLLEFNEPFVPSLACPCSEDWRNGIVGDGSAAFFQSVLQSFIRIVHHQFFAEGVDEMLGASGYGDFHGVGLFDSYGVAQTVAPQAVARRYDQFVGLAFFHAVDGYSFRVFLVGFRQWNEFIENAGVGDEHHTRRVPRSLYGEKSFGSVVGFEVVHLAAVRDGVILFAVGTEAVVIDLIVVVLTLLFGISAGKLLKMDKDISLLTATGSAICGAAAVLGAESVIRPQPYKTAVAVSTVVVFGTIAMFIYPALYNAGAIPLDETGMGVYTGSTLHEVAHVVGAGNAMGENISDTAIIVKMIRVILLAPVLLIMSFSTAGRTGGKRKITVPWFAFGFIAVIGFNSLSLLPASVVSFINSFDTFLLTMAMTALGAETLYGPRTSTFCNPLKHNAMQNNLVRGPPKNDWTANKRFL